MHLTQCLVGLLACAAYGRARDAKSEHWRNDLAENAEDTTQFERVDVPLTFDKGGRYVAGIAMVSSCLHITIRRSINVQ